MSIIQLLILPTLVIGFPQLLTGGFGEADPTSDGVGALWGDAATLFEGLGSAAVNLFKDPDDSDQSTTQTTTTDESTVPDTVSPSATPSIPSGAADIYLTVSAEPATSTPMPAPNENCEPPPQEPGSQACKPPKERLVFSKTCKDFDPFQMSTEEQREQNQVVTNRLIETAGAEKVQIFTSHICDVYVWIVELTDDEVADLLANTPEIQAIEPNQPASFSSLGADRRNPGSRVKREDTTVILDRKAPLHMVFISTPPRTARPRKYYAGDPSGGDGIVIYHFDTGVHESHNEIRRVATIGKADLGYKPMITGYLFGSGLDREDQSDYNGFGTCRLSLVGGRRYGASKKASAVVVKVAENTGSVLTGMMATMDDLPKSTRGVTAGRYVINLGLQWQDSEANPESKESLLHFLRLFMGLDFQIPVVVPLGDEPAHHNAYMDALPAILSSEDIPLITVGAVDPVQGTTYPWSRRGDMNSIYAPGMVACAENMQRGIMNGVFGTDKAAAVVAGVMGYLLGLPGVGDQLRDDPLGVVLAMRQFLNRQASWVRRRGEDRAIWNLNTK